MLNICNPINLFSTRCLKTVAKSISTVKLEDLDIEYLTNPKNLTEIRENLHRRKCLGDIENVTNLHEVLKNSPTKSKTLISKLAQEAAKFPNKSHFKSKEIFEPKLIKYYGTKPSFNFKPKKFKVITKMLNLVRTEGISNFTGPRSYFLLDEMAQYEQALIEYTTEKLLKQGFQIISVPDILPKNVVNSCGMDTTGERNQVYQLDEEAHGKNLCLSGTAEIGIGAFLSNKTINTESLPQRLCAVSRCYRAETSKISEEKGIFRVHQFNKVEMFGVGSDEQQSEKLLEDFISTQISLFTELGLHLRVLEMPVEDLGRQAYRKIDIETWLPGSERWAEISSSSDCTDFQTRRLSIKGSDGRHLFTVNGTACAVPRLLISLVETHQTANSAAIPECLRLYMGGLETLTKSQPFPKPIKNKHFITPDFLHLEK